MFADSLAGARCVRRMSSITMALSRPAGCLITLLRRRCVESPVGTGPTGCRRNGRRAASQGDGANGQQCQNASFPMRLGARCARDQRWFGAGGGRGRDHARANDLGMKRVWPLAQHVRAGGCRETPCACARTRRKEWASSGASNVGRHVIQAAPAFACKSWSMIPSSRQTRPRCWARRRWNWDGAYCGDRTSSRCNAPAKPDTIHMLDARALALMKDNALLIQHGRRVAHR